MALYTDADHVTAADLTALDPEVTTIAASEGITISTVIRQAWHECADELMQYMQAFGDNMFDPLTLASGRRTRINLDQVVVSADYGDTSPLRRWMIYSALTLFYRAALTRSLSDRYEAKYDRMVGQRAGRWSVLWANGLPVVGYPLPCPGAVYVPNAGTFGNSSLSAVAAGSAAQWQARAAVTWVRSAESGPSQIAELTVPANQQLRVSIAGLTPPVGVTGWYVYVGVGSSGTLYRQGGLVPVGTTTFTLADPVATSGVPLGKGQAAERTEPFMNLIQRA